MPVGFEAEGAVGTITLDNPPANSYDLQLMTAFSGAVDDAVASDVRAVIVRSAGDRFFSAGADVKRFLEGDIDASMQMIRTSQAAFARMAAAPQEALEWGLVSALLETGEGAQRVRDQAERFAGGPALALAAIKRCVHEGTQLPLAEGLALEGELIKTLFRSRDGQEGLHAFVEKRSPEFVGA